MFDMNNIKDLNRNLHIHIDKCPHCNNNTYIKYGKYNGEQRYQCKMCKKTFSARTNTPWYHSKKSLETWSKYYYYMFNINSLRECAAKLNINLATAFNWRHKILTGLEIGMKVNELVESVHIQKRISKENRKGQKGVAEKPPRNVWTYFLVDSKDGIIGNPTCIDRWNSKSFMKNVYSRINKKAYIYEIGDRFVNTIAKNHNKDVEENINIDNISVMNRVTNNFYKLLCKYHGIASKYTRRYMALNGILSMKMNFRISDIILNIFGEDLYKKIIKIRKEEIVNF